MTQTGFIKYTQSISVTLTVCLQSSPLWFSAFSLRLRSYIIVSVIKEFSFPVVPLLQSHCIGEWTKLIVCALVTIAVIMEVFLYDQRTAPVSHFLSTRVRTPGVMPPWPHHTSPNQEPKTGKRTQKVHRPLDYGLADTAVVCATSLKLSSVSQHIAEVHDIMGYVQFLSEAKVWWWMKDWILGPTNPEAGCPNFYSSKYFLGPGFIFESQILYRYLP